MKFLLIPAYSQISRELIRLSVRSDEILATTTHPDLVSDGRRSSLR